MADTKVALQSSFTNYEPLDNHKILLKLGDGNGKRNIKLSDLTELTETFFSPEREEKFDVSFDPYLMFDLTENEIYVCGCSNNGGCPLPDIQPRSDSEKIICFETEEIIHKKRRGIKIDCLQSAIKDKFGDRDESVRLWFGSPNVVVQLME